MGWLRELMQVSQPKLQSFDALARRCLAHPSWPEGGPKQRSFASMLGRMDRKQDLDWLRDRPEVQAILAEALDAPISDLKVELSEAVDPRLEFQNPLLRLEDLPFARALRLDSEPLPPGIPWLPQRPSAWKAIWWHAPSGSGRSLVGRWLTARRAARWLVGTDYAQLEADSQEPGPVYLELLSRKGTGSLQQNPPRQQICIAADFLPQNPAAWLIVKSPPLSAYLEELIAWAIERLPADSRLELAACYGWITSPELSSVLDNRFAGALGLIGLADELGVDQLHHRSPIQLAQAYLKFRSATMGAEARWFKTSGVDYLVDLARQALLDMDAPLLSPRRERAWTELLRQSPKRLGRTTSVEGEATTEPSHQFSPEKFILTLIQYGLLKPSFDPASRATAALGSAPITTEEEASLAPTYQLSPYWLAQIVSQHAIEQAFSAGPYEWGEALLSPAQTPLLLQGLAKRLRRDSESFIDDLLDLPTEPGPGYAAALEAVLRVLGAPDDALRTSGLLAELSPEVLEALWAEQSELLISFPEEFCLPRIEYPAELCAELPVLSRGAWYLALWAISEALQSRIRQYKLSRSPLLNPWSTHQQQSLNPALDAIERWLSIAPNPAAESLLLRLCERRRENSSRQPALTAPRPLHELELPEQIIHHFRTGTLSWQLFEPFRPAALMRVQRALSAVDYRALIKQLVLAWGAAESPASGRSWFDGRSEANSLVWPYLGPIELKQLLSTRTHAEPVEPLHIPWELLSSDAWQALLELWRSAPRPAALSGPRSDAFEAAAPSSVIAQDLLAQPLTQLWGPSALRRSWKNCEEIMFKALEARFEAALEAQPGARAALFKQLAALLDAQADIQDGTSSPNLSLELIKERLPRFESQEPLLSAILGHLHYRITNRTPGWRSAYQLLNELEGRRRRIRKAQL